MTRPPVSVVMPFAGSRTEAGAALQALRALGTGAEDELILADNSGTASPRQGVLLVPAAGERSPSHARNAGAARARREWILFLDADCRAPADLLDRFFDDPVEPDVGALAGAVVPAPGAGGFAASYGAAKNFLNQDAHLAHGYMPRAAAANLMVRREAFRAVGGFYEGVRAAEDTDFAWRLQRAGWRLEGRPEARVQHRYRTTVRALRRQWRGYAAGRAWLARRYDDFEPEPALKRAAGRALRRGDRDAAAAGAGWASAESTGSPPPSRLQRGGFLALDALLGVEELAGFTLSNRPRRDGRPPARVILVADRFPARGDPLADFALTLAGARVEAAARPDAVEWEAARGLTVDYREDDGAAARALATGRLLIRHPLRCIGDRLARIGRRRRTQDVPRLSALAPAVMRMKRDTGARVQPLGSEQPRAVAVRLARLSGRPLE